MRGAMKSSRMPVGCLLEFGCPVGAQAWKQSGLEVTVTWDHLLNACPVLACPGTVTQSTSSHLCKMWVARNSFTTKETGPQGRKATCAEFSQAVHVGCESGCPGLWARALREGRAPHRTGLGQGNCPPSSSPSRPDFAAAGCAEEKRIARPQPAAGPAGPAPSSGE